MTSEAYSREYIDNINRKNQYTAKLAAPGNFVDNRNLAKIIYNRRNNSTDIRREKIGKEINDYPQNYDNNDNDALLSKLVTQVPKNTNLNIMNSSRPNTGAVNQDLKMGSDAAMNSPRPNTNTERVSYSMSPNRMKNLSYNKLLPPRSKENTYKKTLVLDLDETLVHSAFKKFERGSDIVLKIELEGRYHDIHVLVRPGVDEFLEKMAKHYELVVFTASLSKYAEPLVDRLDPKGVCFFRLFREHCTMINGAFVKDLKRLDRDLKDVIILDNSPISYALNSENGFPIKSWYEDKSDRELLNIIPILEFLANVNDVRDFIKKMTERNDISYNKAFSIMNAYKKEMENKAQLQNNINNNGNNNEPNLKLVDKMGKRTPSNLSSNLVNQNFVNNSNAPSGRNTPKYSSNILSKNKDSGTNNIKLVNNNNLPTPIINNNNENIANENIDGKGNISIKFINHNINHFIISSNNNSSNPNNNNAATDGYINAKKGNSSSNNASLIQQMKSTGNNFMGMNNPASPLAKESQKPEKKSKKINAFRNVAKPQTALGNQFNTSNKELATKSNLNRIQNNNNIRVPENFDSYLHKTPNSPNNNMQNYVTNNNSNNMNNNYDNIMVNHSQPMQHGIFNKYNIKQLNINNGEFSPVNRATRGSITLHSTINKNTNNNSLRFSKQENQIQYSRPSSASNSKNKPSGNSHPRDKSSNSMKDPYNNPSIIATIKRTPSTNSLVKSLTRNYSKPTVGNEKGNANAASNARGFLNINRQTPKNYSGSIDMNKNGDLVRNSFNNVNMIGIEKPKTGNKLMNSNNLNIKAPTLNSIVDNEFIKRGYSLSSRSINPQIRYKPINSNDYLSNITPNNKYTPTAVIRSSSFIKNERY